MRRLGLLQNCLLATALAGSWSMAAMAADYNPVTDERLQNPEPENWLSWRGNYEGWGYSPLDQITAENVERPGAGLVLFDRRGRGPSSAADSSMTA